MEAFTRVRNLVEYEMYHNDKVKAIKALRKKFPSISIDECTLVFDRVFEMYIKTIKFVNRNCDFYWDLYHKGLKEKNFKPDLSDFEKEYILTFPEIPSRIVESTIGWIFYWHHLR